MKNYLRVIFAATLFSSSALLPTDSMKEQNQAAENLWTGAGAHDGAYTATVSSMLGWGAGAAVVIASLSALLSSGSGSGSSSHAHHCH